MEGKSRNRNWLVAAIGGVILAVILIGGTVWMGQSAHRDTSEAARSVSLLYLDELAGRREQVVENNLKNNIHGDLPFGKWERAAARNDNQPTRIAAYFTFSPARYSSCRW